MTPAGAQQASDGESLTEVTVSGYRFLSEDTSGTTNLPLPVEKVPQTITLVSSGFIEAANLKSLGEIAQYSPGVAYTGAIGGSVSQIQLRGFLTSYTFDGLTTGNIVAEPDPSVIERVEIVKGPSSVVYGAASPGGVVNLVLKGAEPDTPSYLSVLAGSWSRYRIEGQVAGALNSSGSVRGIAIGDFEDADSYIDYYSQRKSTLYAGLDAELTGSVKTYFRAAREQVIRPGFGGFGFYADGTPPPIDDSFILAPSDDLITSTTYRFSGGAGWEISPMWSVELKGNYSNSTHRGPAPLFSTILAPNNGFNILTRNLAFDLQDWNVGAFTTFKLDDLGLDDSFVSASAIYTDSARRQFTLFPTINGLTSVPTNLSLGTDGLVALIDREVFPGINPSLNQQHLNYLIVSGQAVIEIVDSLSVLAGASVSDAGVENKVLLNGPWVNYDPDRQVSYRAALMYEPVTGLNVYASYSESFQPNFRTDRDDRVLPPVMGSQYELGAKYISPNRGLLLTASVFELEQKNTAVITTFIGPDGFARYTALGEVRHRGLELSAVGRLTDQWQLQAAYTHLDPKIVKDVTAANIGRTRPWIPLDTASVFTDYTFANGLFVAAGARYVSGFDTTILATTRPFDSYTLLDASLGYTFGSWRAQLNLKNLTDESYFLNSSANLSGGTLFGEPRSFALSLRKDF